MVCPESLVPAGVKCERGWRCLRVEGILAFSMVGILASLVTPLADSGISVFAISTFDTDYLLFRDGDTETTLAALQRAGHMVST
jgi:hypothetical protein